MIPRPIVTLARLFGFAYPKKVIVFVDKDDKMIFVEDFTITKKLEQDDLGKKQQNQQQEEEEKEKEEEKQKSRVSEITIITDKKTGEIYAVQGDADTLFVPKRPAEVFREAGISAVLPGFIIYNLLIFWAFEALPPIEPIFMSVLGTALILMSVFNARYAYFGIINHFVAIEKADVGGLKVFVPAIREYLALRPSENKHLRDAVVSAIVAKIRPLEAENEKLMEVIHQTINKVDTAFKLGVRLRNTFLPTLERIPAPGLLIGVFVVGLILGWILSGGVGLAQPANGSAVP